jgi:hypothetical protein
MKEVSIPIWSNYVIEFPEIEKISVLLYERKTVIYRMPGACQFDFFFWFCSLLQQTTVQYSRGRRHTPAQHPKEQSSKKTWKRNTRSVFLSIHHTSTLCCNMPCTGSAKAQWQVKLALSIFGFV